MRAPILFLMMLLLLGPGWALGQQAPAEAPPAGEAAPPAPATPEIPEPSLAETVGDAGAATAQLRQLESDLAPDPALEDLLAKLPPEVEQLEERAEAALERVEQAAQLRQLKDVESRWLDEQERLERLRAQVTGRALAIEESLGRIKKLTATWEKSREEAKKVGAPAAVLERIGATLQAAQTAREGVGKYRAETLELQSTIGGALGVVADVLERARRAQQAIRGGLLGTDSLPLWTAIRVGGEFEDTLARAVEIRRNEFNDIIAYASGELPELAVHLAVLVLAIFTTLALRPRALHWAEEDETARPSALLLSRPYAAGVLISLLAFPILYVNAPSNFEEIFLLAALLATMRLLSPLLEREVRPAFYALTIFFVLDRVRDMVSSTPLLARLVFNVELAGFLLVLLVLLGTARLALLPRGDSRLAIFVFIRRLALLLVGLALVSSVLGYINLSRIIGDGVMRSAYTGVVLYGVYKVLSGMVGIFLRGRIFSGVRVIDGHRQELTRGLTQIARLGALFWWISESLRHFKIRDEFSTALGTVFSTGLSVGELEISLGGVIVFVVSVAIAIYVSRFVRYVLDEDVLARLDLPRGVPYAISSSAFYVILMLGFTAALAAAGIDLTRFTILAGALGVGIGFGLQNVVNNFVSGLILLFERPIKTGDTIEVGALMGEVRRIGIRASVVRTWQGAEVIVPNATLISDAVINWTLSDRQRRIEIDVGVKYGTDPERVLALLIEVAKANEQILEQPEPSALFLAFGDSSLNFRLRAWTAQFDSWTLVRSDLTVAVNRALAEAGIEIPFPQRDLHVRSVDERAGQALAAPQDRS